MTDFFRELNRPSHLARRDAAVERAVEALYRPVQAMDVQSRLAHVEEVLTLLETAVAHADLAARSMRTTQRETDFRRFLDLIRQNVKSVDALLRNQAHFESEKECFLTQFLGANTQDAGLSAVNYQRRSEDLLHGLWQVLRLSHAPYRTLQEENLSTLNPNELERYRRGYAHYREEFQPSGGKPRPDDHTDASGI